MIDFGDCPIIVTGAAGFVGHHVAQRLLDLGAHVVGVDCFTPYYDPRLKEARFQSLRSRNGFIPERVNIAEPGAIAEVFARHKPAYCIHLAAQPGVRLGFREPEPYISSNIIAFVNVLEACRYAGVKHLVFASSSSVYGNYNEAPFEEDADVDHPISLYAATKRSNELMAFTYSHAFEMPATGLRFFTVYGPWGRPDMAYYSFTDDIANGRPIKVANGGHVWRDFTYIDDIVEGILRVAGNPPQPSKGARGACAVPFDVFNIGNNKPEELNRLISLIEDNLGRRAIRIDQELPQGDVTQTHANIGKLEAAVGFSPSTPLEVGVGRFVKWYQSFNGVNAEARHVRAVQS
jgi:UDP-glucuronate 4-epimerase